MTGYDLTDPREANIVRIALAVGRLAQPDRPRLAPPGRPAATTPTSPSGRRPSL